MHLVWILVLGVGVDLRAKAGARQNHGSISPAVTVEEVRGMLMTVNNYPRTSCRLKELNEPFSTSGKSDERVVARLALYRVVMTKQNVDRRLRTLR
jgi:hypothetical protein